MNITEYKKQAMRTCAPLDNTDNNIHMILGMVTEVGELADVFKKELAYGKDVDWVNVKEELGDLMWYIINFCTINNINLEDVLDTNIEKLKARYPDKFTREYAITRNLQNERTILEKRITRWD